MRGKSDSIYWFRVVLLSFAVVCCAAVGAWSQVVLRVGPGQQYATIQSAVDAARTGDAILVYPSTYKESVNVNKNGLKLVAQGDGVTVGPPPAEGKACFEVRADGIVIQGFNLTGTNCAAAIDFVGSYNRFSDNHIFGLTCPGVNALACRAPNGGSNFNVIENNDVTEADLGIVVGSDSQTAINKGNIIIGNHVYGVGTVGVVVYNGTGCMVAGNVIEGIPFGLGISIIAQNNVPQFGHVVTGNKISNTAEGGVGVFADETASLSKVTVSYNDIISPGGFGIVLQKDSGANLAHNVISGNCVSKADAVGIIVDTGANNNKLDSNLVFDNVLYGIQVKGNHNKITSNTALGNNTYDLIDNGRGNRWKDNVYETCSWCK